MDKDLEVKDNAGPDHHGDQTVKVMELAAKNRAAALGLAVCLVLSTSLLGCGKKKPPAKEEEKEEENNASYSGGGGYHGGSSIYIRSGSQRSSSWGKSGFASHSGKSGGYSGVRGGSFGS